MRKRNYNNFLVEGAVRNKLAMISNGYLEDSVVPSYLSRSELLLYITKAIELAKAAYIEEHGRKSKPQAIKPYTETIKMLIAVSACSRALQLQYRKEDGLEMEQPGVPWVALNNLVKNIIIHYKPSHGLSGSVVVDTHLSLNVISKFVEQICINDLDGFLVAIEGIRDKGYFVQSVPVALTIRKIDEFLSSEKQFGLLVNAGDFLSSQEDIAHLLTEKEGRIRILRNIGVVGEAFSALEENLRICFVNDAEIGREFVEECRKVRNALDHAEAEFRAQDSLHNTVKEIRRFVLDGSLQDGSVLKTLMVEGGSKFGKIKALAEVEVESLRVRVSNTDAILLEKDKYLQEFYNKVINNKGSLSDKIHFLFSFKNREAEESYQKISSEVITSILDQRSDPVAFVSKNHKLDATLLYLDLFKEDFRQASDKSEAELNDLERGLLKDYAKVRDVYRLKINKISQGKFDFGYRFASEDRVKYLKQYVVSEFIDPDSINYDQIGQGNKKAVKDIPNRRNMQMQNVQDNLGALIESCRKAIKFTDLRSEYARTGKLTLEYKDDISSLQCAIDFHQINAGSHARSLNENKVFLEEASGEVKTFLDKSLRVVRGYLSHNTTQRLGAGDEGNMHSSSATGIEIQKMIEMLPALEKLLEQVQEIHIPALQSNSASVNTGISR
jgi:hypothetical protein